VVYILSFGDFLKFYIWSGSERSECGLEGRDGGEGCQIKRDIGFSERNELKKEAFPIFKIPCTVLFSIVIWVWHVLLCGGLLLLLCSFRGCVDDAVNFICLVLILILMIDSGPGIFSSDTNLIVCIYFKKIQIWHQANLKFMSK